MVSKANKITIFLVAVVSVAGLSGCSKEEKSTSPPTSGDALRKHLLGILDARKEAYSAGDLKTARSYEWPYSVASNRVFYELMGIPFDRPPTKAQLESARKRKIPPLFSADSPIELETAGSWARLRQEKNEDEVSYAYFLLEDGKWWVVSAYFGDSGKNEDDRFAYLCDETYWPDHIDEYFSLPQVRLDVKTSSKPPYDNTFYDWLRLAIHVTNTSDKTISALSMKRFFTSVQFHDGESQSAADPSGGEPFRDLKPGETIYVGDVEICKPKSGPGVAFYVGPYVSERVPAEPPKP